MPLKKNPRKVGFQRGLPRMKVPAMHFMALDAGERADHERLFKRLRNERLAALPKSRKKKAKPGQQLRLRFGGKPSAGHQLSLFNPGRGPDRAPRAMKFSPRERQILRAAQGGLTARETATMLGIHYGNVTKRKELLMAKLGASSTAEAVKFARQRGII